MCECLWVTERERERERDREREREREEKKEKKFHPMVLSRSLERLKPARLPRYINKSRSSVLLCVFLLNFLFKGLCASWWRIRFFKDELLVYSICEMN